MLDGHVFIPKSLEVILRFGKRLIGGARQIRLLTSAYFGQLGQLFFQLLGDQLLVDGELLKEEIRHIFILSKNPLEQMSRLDRRCPRSCRQLGCFLNRLLRFDRELVKVHCWLVR